MIGLLKNVVRENLLTPTDIPRLEAKLFFEGAARRRSLERFSVLLALSGIIATYAVLNDSSATVIGAMIIAPLMTPIMATAAAIVMGQRLRAVKSLLLVVAGVVGTVGLAWLLARFFPGIISFESNTQITSRVAPNLVDLFIALASGAAGAFAMSRDDVADSLPGVAIAIALVPPLSVIGIALAEGQMAEAWGATLLFLTNFLSILLAGGGVLALLGLGNAATSVITGKARRDAFIAIGIGVLLVALPLTGTSFTIVVEAYAQHQASVVAEEWIEDTDYQVRRVRVSGETVYVLISGTDESPAPEDLLDGLHESLQRPVTLDLEIVPSLRQTFPAQSAEQLQQHPASSGQAHP